jgi:hypothetical protein
LENKYISPLISIYMPVWENSKDEINHLKNILEIQNNLISNLLKMNQGLYDQLTNYRKEHDKAVVDDDEQDQKTREHLKNNVWKYILKNDSNSN